MKKISNAMDARTEHQDEFSTEKKMRGEIIGVRIKNIMVSTPGRSNQRKTRIDSYCNSKTRQDRIINLLWNEEINVEDKVIAVIWADF